MLDFLAKGWGHSSFEGNRLPQLAYITPLSAELQKQQESAVPSSYAELSVVCDGTCLALADGRIEELRRGDFLLCSAGEPHSLRADADTPFAGIRCGFSHLQIRGLEENCFLHPNDPPIVHAGNGGQELIAILNLLERAAADPLTRTEELCSYLSAAAVLTAVLIHRAATERTEQAHYELAVRSRMYLDRHYLEPLTLDSFAQAMGVSKYHLDRVFSRSHGCTPNQYITRRRISRAQTLLASTTQSVRHIAEQCGYTNYNYFTVLFRKTVGKTPGEYRKLIQGGNNSRG